MSKLKNINYWERVLQNPLASYQQLFTFEQDLLQGLVTKDHTVLDVGCGEGRIIAALAPKAGHVTGIDIDPQAVAHTKQNLHKFSNVTIVQGNVTSLPFDDCQFDVVNFSMTLVNLDKHKIAALQEMGRTAKQNGLVVVSVYTENAQDERREMYTRVEVPIIKEENGRFEFAGEGFVSEQFTLNELQALCNAAGLRIDRHHKIGTLAYVLVLSKHSATDQ